jgi:hypothetical protein
MDTRNIGVREAREKLGNHVNDAHYLNQHTVIERNGTPYAVLVPYTWWAEQQKQAGHGTLAP